MRVILLLCRLLLAGVFATAAAAKLADRDGTSRAVTDFGLPPSLARPLALLLPLAEFTVAILLITTSSGSWGGVGALALLLIFSIGITANLIRGRNPDCHCFGQLRSKPIGWPTIIRNFLFAAGSGLIIWQSHEKPVA